MVKKVTSTEELISGLRRYGGHMPTKRQEEMRLKKEEEERRKKLLKNAKFE